MFLDFLRPDVRSGFECSSGRRHARPSVPTIGTNTPETLNGGCRGSVAFLLVLIVDGFQGHLVLLGASKVCFDLLSMIHVQCYALSRGVSPVLACRFTLPSPARTCRWQAWMAWPRPWTARCARAERGLLKLGFPFKGLGLFRVV